MFILREHMTSIKVCWCSYCLMYQCFCKYYVKFFVHLSFLLFFNTLSITDQFLPCFLYNDVCFFLFRIAQILKDINFPEYLYWSLHNYQRILVLSHFIVDIFVCQKQCQLLYSYFLNVSQSCWVLFVIIRFKMMRANEMIDMDYPILQSILTVPVFYWNIFLFVYLYTFQV